MTFHDITDLWIFSPFSTICIKWNVRWWNPAKFYDFNWVIRQITIPDIYGENSSFGLNFQWAILISSSWKPISVLFCRLKIKGLELPVWIGKAVHTLVDKRRKDWQFCYINNIGPILFRFKVCSTENFKEYHWTRNGYN